MSICYRFCIVLFLSLAVCVATSSSGLAYCVSNDGDQAFMVCDDCQTFGCFEVIVEPGAKQCCPAKDEKCKGDLVMYPAIGKASTGASAPQSVLGRCDTGRSGWARVRVQPGQGSVEECVKKD